jgi:hypothetical protein
MPPCARQSPAPRSREFPPMLICRWHLPAADCGLPPARTPQLSPLPHAIDRDRSRHGRRRCGMAMSCRIRPSAGPRCQTEAPEPRRRMRLAPSRLPPAIGGAALSREGSRQDRYAPGLISRAVWRPAAVDRSSVDWRYEGSCGFLATFIKRVVISRICSPALVNWLRRNSDWMRIASSSSVACTSLRA